MQNVLGVLPSQKLATTVSFIREVAEKFFEISEAKTILFLFSLIKTLWFEVVFSMHYRFNFKNLIMFAWLLILLHL